METYIPETLEAIIQDYLSRDEDNGFHSFTVGEYYPHTIGFCPLRYYYIYKEGPYELPDDAKGRVKLGSIIHSAVLSSLEDYGYIVEKEFEIDLFDGAKLVGRVDAYSSEGIPHIIEVKTVDRLPFEPYPNHVLQIHAYLLAFDYFDYAVLMYISRRNFSRRYFEIRRDDEKTREVVSWVKTLHDSLVSSTPPAPSPVASWECSGCPFRYKCGFSNL